MITEDYVSFDTAKLLKEKGFEGDTSCYFVPDSSKHWIYQHYHDFDKKDRIECPTLQMVMKWLRENFKIIATIVPEFNLEFQENGKWLYKYFIIDLRNDDPKGMPFEMYTTYELACEAAIKYCLENLI